MSKLYTKGQKKPFNLIRLTTSEVSAKTNPTSKLLCNWRNCTMDNGNPAKALRLCGFCHRVGYCCTWCMEQDIYGHVTHECAQNIKKAKFIKN